MDTFPTPDDLKKLSVMQKQANKNTKLLREIYEENYGGKIKVPVSFDDEAMAFFSAELSRIETSLHSVNDALDAERQAREESEKEQLKQKAEEKKRFGFTAVLGILTLIVGAIAAITGILMLFQ